MKEDPILYNQSIDFQNKSVDLFLYDREFLREIVKWLV